MSIFARKKKFHFVGIGGVGMSGIAEILLHLGHQVSGSDRQKSELTDYLESLGAKIYEGHRTDYVSNVDYLIYSSAISGENPEMKEAQRKNITKIRRAEMLGQLMNRKLGIAVAGTHGKTTTTSMIGHVLIETGMDPTIIVGGRLKNLKTNARLGSSDYLVTEADEYDRSFLTLFPRIAVITSLEADHLDIYEDLNDLKSTFQKFANQVTFDGSIVVCIDDINIQAIRPEIENTVLTYGFSENAQYRAENINFKDNQTWFEVKTNSEQIGKFELKVPGEHNVKNALAVIAVCGELEIPFPEVRNALATFTGVDRRFEIKDTINNIMIVDDYAHHPTEVKATLRSARNGWDRRIIAVFQPHLYSRTRDFYKEFADVLSEADITIITDVYPAREDKIEDVSGALISNELKRIGHSDTIYHANKRELAKEIYKLLQPNDMVITMGAGDIWQTADDLLKILKEN